jgi:DNA-binding NarL/FixJ family response regulator
MIMTTSDTSIRVLLIDDHKIVAEALSALLIESGDFRVVGIVNDPADIVKSIAEHKPDVVICDLEMPGGDPLDRALEGISLSNDSKLLVLSAYPTDAHIARAVQMGVCGFLSKHEPAEAVVDGIRAVHSGYAIYSDEVRDRIVTSKSDSQTELKVLTLTPRELSVVRLVAMGMTTSQIAESIHRSPKTIDNQISSALSKTQSSNRVELSRWAIREGLIEA